MAKQQQKPKQSGYRDYMANIDPKGQALSSAQRILSNGSKSAIALNKKVSKDAINSTKKVTGVFKTPTKKK